MSIHVLRKKQVLNKTGFSNSTLYLRISKGEFPPPISLSGGGGGRAVGWVESEVDDWLEMQINTSRQAGAHK